MKISILILFILFAACSRYPHDVENALKLAGENRQEIEKVLQYYTSPGDSLKYKAAVFLIKNSLYHFGYYSGKFERYDAVWDSMYARYQYKSFSKHKHTNRVIRKKLFQQILDLCRERLGEVTSHDFGAKLDIEELSAEFLIENIEYAFKAWEFPWSRNYNFEQFCNYILPYRYGNEPLESWRPFYVKQLAWLPDSVLEKDNSKEAAMLLDVWLSRNAYVVNDFKPFPGGLKCSNFMKFPAYRNCYDKAGLCVSCLRAMGIPATVIAFPKWGNNNEGHAIAAFLDHEGQWQSIMEISAVGYRKSFSEYTVPKIYKMHYDVVQTGLDLAVYQRLPYLLYSEDISANYINTIDIDVDIDPRVSKGQKFAFICTFDRPDWQPVFWGEIRKGKVRFKNMGTGMIYLPVIFKDDKLVPAGSPIKVNKGGDIRKMEISPAEMITCTFDRKFPTNDSDIVKSRCEDMIGGRFECADNKEFYRSKIMYEIGAIPPYYPEIKKINSVKTKFARYCFPVFTKSQQNGPGQISFYTTRDSSLQRLEGVYFGSPGVTQDNLFLLFDDNILSYVLCSPYETSIGENRVPEIVLYQGSQADVWVGVEFEKKETITHIGYCVRNDKNGIYPGMTYELLHWENGWKPLGTRTASDSTVTFTNIPGGALLWLRNLDEGEAERICTIEEGQITWW